MLNNRVYLMSPSTGLTDDVVGGPSIVDLSTKGRSVRKDASRGITMTVGQVPTAENPAYETLRTTVRLEKALSGLSVETQPKGRSYVQLIVSHPTDDNAPTTVVHDLVAALINLLVLGDIASPATSGMFDVTAGETITTVDRLLNGEL